MKTDKIIAFVMAGGQGSRLQPLTAARSKPSVPFGARYRIVDFVLSNLVNSQIQTIYLLVQYKSQSLIEHVRRAWTISPLLQSQFVTVVPPQMRYGQHWFQGTADAIHQNLNLIDRDLRTYIQPGGGKSQVTETPQASPSWSYVLVFGANGTAIDVLYDAKHPELGLSALQVQRRIDPAAQKLPGVDHGKHFAPGSSHERY